MTRTAGYFPSTFRSRALVPSTPSPVAADIQGQMRSASSGLGHDAAAEITGADK